MCNEPLWESIFFFRWIFSNENYEKLRDHNFQFEIINLLVKSVSNMNFSGCPVDDKAFWWRLVSMVNENRIFIFQSIIKKYTEVIYWIFFLCFFHHQIILGDPYHSSERIHIILTSVYYCICSYYLLEMNVCPIVNINNKEEKRMKWWRHAIERKNVRVK